MKEGWTYKKLGEVCDTINGLWKGKKPPYINVGVIRNANFTKEFTIRYDNIEYLDVEEKQYAKRKLQKGDLIIEKSGGGEKQPVGRVVLFDKDEGEFSFSNFTSVLRIKDNKELISEFLYIYLLYIYKRGDTLKMQKATTGIHNIEFDKYLAIDIPCLPLSEQQRIVARLDAAFAHIDELKANAEKQLSEARTLFQKALTKAMEPKEGWEEKTLKDLTTKIGSGATPRGGSKVYISEGVSFVRSLNVHYDEFKYKDLAHINGEAAKQLNGVELKKDDVLFNITGASIARCCVMPEDVLPARVNQHVSILRPRKDLVLPRFLCLGLISSEHQRVLLEIGVAGSTRQAVTKSDLEQHLFPIPPLSEQQRIVERLDSLSENVKALEENQQKVIAECDALKQALLRKVFE